MNDDWDWIFEFGFWLFAPFSVIVVVLILDYAEVIDVVPWLP